MPTYTTPPNELTIQLIASALRLRWSPRERLIRAGITRVRVAMLPADPEIMRRTLAWRGWR